MSFYNFQSWKTVNYGHLATGLLLAFMLIGSVSGQTGFNIADSVTDFYVQDSSSDGNWTVYFNSTEDSQISFELVQESSKLSFDRLEYRESGSWVERAAQVSGDTVTTDWTGSENSYGRVVYRVNDFGRYGLNVSIKDSSRVVYSPGKHEQNSFQFNFDNPVVQYDLCAFNSNFWTCSPSKDQDRKDPGYDGEVIDLNGAEDRKFEIPNSSTVDSFSLKLQTLENKSLMDITGQGIEFAEISSDSRKEILVFEGSKLKAFNSTGSSLWNYTASNSINSIESGDEKALSSEEEIILATENSLILLYSNGTKIWSISGSEYYDTSTGELSSENTFYTNDDGGPENFTCIGCGNTNSSRFTVPYSVTNVNNTIYVKTGLNYYNKSNDLKFELNGSTYDVDEDLIDTSAVFENKADDGSIEDMASLGDRSVLLNIPQDGFDSKNIYLKLPLAKNPSKTGNLTVDINGNSYILPRSKINAVSTPSIESSSASEQTSVANIQSSAVYTGGFDPGTNNSVYIGAPFNKIGGESSDITVSLNNTNYTIEGEKIKESSRKSFKADDGSPEGSSSLTAENSTFNLWYSVPEDLNSEKIYVKSAVSYFGDKSGQPYLKINGSHYNLDKSEVAASSSEQFGINDNSSENESCIGCEDDLNPPHPLFDLSAFNLSGFSAETAYLSAPICYRGSKVDDLVLKGSGLSNTEYDVNISEIPACSSGAKWISTPVDPQNLQEDYILYNCKTCNSTSHYELKADNSTSGQHSQFYLGSGTNYDTDLPYDYMINLTTDSSLDYSWVETKVDKKDLAQGENITFGCESCDKNNFYHLMQDSSNGNHSYFNNGTETTELAKDYMVRVWTNTSLNHTWAYTRVNSTDLDSNTNVTFSCDSCGSGYNALYDSGVSGSSYYNGSQLSGELFAKAEKRPLNTSWTKLKVNKSDVRNADNVTISCKNCENQSAFIGLDFSSGQKAYSKKDGKTFIKDAGSIVRTWSNTSLKYDWIRTEINGSDIAQGENITFKCSNCNTPAFNIMLDGDSSSDSYEYDNGFKKLSQGYMVRVESFGSNTGKEIVASKFPSVISALNSSSSEIWNYSTSKRPYAVDVGDVSPDTGNEVVAGTKDQLVILDSSGSLVSTYPDSGTEWFRSLTLADLFGDSRKEVVGGTDSGKVVAINSTAKHWETDLGSKVKSLESGNISKKKGPDILAGLEDGRLVLLNSTGGVEDTYQQGSGIESLEKGDIKSLEGDEIGVSTTDSMIFNLYYLPVNLSVDFRADGSNEWVKNGVFAGSQTLSGSSFVNAFNNEIASCNTALCNVTLRFNSDSSGRFKVSRPKVEYTYNASETVSKNEGVTRWAKKEVKVGEKVMYSALHINYPTSPEVPLRAEDLTSDDISNVLSNQGTSEIVFNNRTFNISTPYIDLPTDLRYWRFETGSRGDDYVWYNNSKEAAPIAMTKTSLTDEATASKNVTILRNTSKTNSDFINVTVELAVNDSKISGNNFLEVDWNNNGSFADITPSSTDCSSYEKKTAEGGTFYVCMEDQDSNGKVDRIKWLQPKVGATASTHNSTTYRTGGSTNSPPSIDSTSTSAPDYWGEDFIFNATVNDTENDDVNVTLWTEIDSTWEERGTKTVSNNASFNVTSYRNWTQGTKYLFEYQDINSSLEKLHDKSNTTAETFEVNPHDTITEYVSGDSQNVDREGENAVFKARLKDNVTGNYVSQDAICILNIDGSLAEVETPNSTGYCTYSVKDFNKPVGQHSWDIQFDSNDYFKQSNTPQQSFTLIGNFTVGNTSFESKTLYRPDTHQYSQLKYNYTNIQDLLGNTVSPSYTVEWGGNTVDSGTATNISGTVDLLDDEQLGYRTVNLTLSDTNFNTKKIVSNITVYGVLKTDLSSSKTTVYASDDLVNLTASIKDVKGDNTSAEVEFQTPDGECKSFYNSSNSYTCEFDPADSLSAGDYTWEAKPSKQFYVYEEDESKTLTVRTPIDADISTTEGSVYRYDGEENTSVSYNVSNITDGVDSLDNVDYTVYWSGSSVDSGTTNSNGFSSSFDVPDTETLGDTELVVELEKGSYKPLNHSKTLSVRGTLNPSTFSTDPVFKNNSETFAGNYNLTTDLEVDVENMAGNSVTGASLSFNTPEGTCSTSEVGNGVYKCVYEPNGLTTVGVKNWDATVSKTYYDDKTTSQETVKVKNVLRPEFVSDGNVYDRLKTGDLNVETVDPSGSKVEASSFNASYYINSNFESEERISSGDTNYGWNTQCTDTAGSYNVEVSLEDMNVLYDIYQQNATGSVELHDNITLNMTSPLDINNEGTNYRQGDEVDLGVDLNDSCGSPSGDYEVIWNASDRDTDELIGNGETRTWTIPDYISGETNITSYVDYQYYEGGFETHEMLVDRVINVNISKGHSNKTRGYGGSYDYNFQADIITGDGQRANNSNIDETWSDFNISFYVDGAKQKEISTDNNGTVSTTLTLDSNYIPGQHSVKARLENTSSIDTKILNENQSKSFDIIDKANVTLDKPSSNSAFYKQDLLLNSSLTTATSAEDSLSIDYSWIFSDEDDSITISSEKNSSWTVPSYAYGDGNLTVEADNPYIGKTNDTKALEVKRRVSIDSYDPDRYVPPSDMVNLTALIDIPGLNDKSDYNVTIWLGNLSDNETVQTNTTGYASRTINTSKLEKGAYETGTIIENSSEKHFEAEDPYEKNTTIVIPDVLNISAYWRDNNEAVLGSKTASDEDGTNFDNLPNRVVYRNPGPWKEPDKLYLGANVTTPFASDDEKYDVENATAYFWVNGTSDNGTLIDEQVGSCTINMTEFENAQNDNQDTWWDDYLCHTEWDPRSEFPVGNYTLKINASHPEEGWNADAVTMPLTVKGVLNITVDTPSAHQDIYQMDNFSFSATVKDQNDYEFSETELDELYWTLEEDYCANTGDNGAGSGGPVMDWDDAIAHGGRVGKLSTWIIMGNTGNYNINGNEMVWLEAEKEFYEVTQNEYRRGFTDCSAVFHQWSDTKGDTTDQFEGDRDDRVGQAHDVIARVEAKWNSPSQHKVETDDNDKLNVSARFFEYNTTETLPNDFEGNYYATCEDCSDSANKDLGPQSAESYLSDEDAQFTFDFTNEEYQKNYTIKIWAEASDNDYKAVAPYNSTNKTFKVYNSLGSGDGSCTINGVCEIENGENVESCSADCGYDNLPKEFWVNETADSQVNQTQYDQFKNTSASEYESGVSYYEDHSSYSNDGAGGCNFDGQENTTYEDRDYCADFITVEQPPEVDNAKANITYVRPEGTKVEISADVKDPNGNLNLVNLTDVSEDSIVDYLTTTSGSCDTQFCKFKKDFVLSAANTFKIYANDTQGNTGTDSEFDVKLDNTNVSITTIQTPQGPFQDGETFTVTVNLTNVDTPDPRPQTVDKVTVEGNTATYNSDNSAWETTVTADSADTTLNVYAREISGYQDTDTKSYTVDDTPPSVQNEGANTTLVAGNAPVQLYANITDPYLDATWVERQSSTVCDNSTLVNTDGDTYRCNITASGTSGTYTYELYANDTAGNLNDTETVDVTVDATPPSVTNTAVNATVINSGTTVEISSDISDARLDKTYVTSFYENWNDGEPNDSGNEDCGELHDSGNWNDLDCSNTNPGLCETPSGSYYTTSSDTWVNARDACRASGDNLVTIENENESQYLTSNYGRTWIGYNDREEEGKWLWSENNATGEIYCDDSTFADTGGGTYKCDLQINETQGLAAFANDTLGNWNYQNTTVKVDEDAPNVTLNAPVKGKYRANIDINATVEDQNLDLSTVIYKVQNSTINDSYSLAQNGNYWTASLDTTAFKDGNYTFWAQATDKADNTNTTSTSDIQFDNTPPSVSFDDPTNAQDVTGNRYFNVTIMDNLDNGNASTYEYKLQNTSGTQIGWSGLNADTGDKYYTQIDTTTYGDGSYTFKVRGSDTVGNSGTDSISVTFDNQPPQITITQPSASEYVRQNITVRADISDTAGNGDQPTYECKLGSISWKSMSLYSSDTYECEINTTNAADGSRDLKVRANDTFDHKNQKSISLNVDNTAPTLDTVTINDSFVQTGMSIQVNVTTPGDTGSDLSFLEIDDKINITYDSGNSAWTGTTSGESDSTINALGVDIAGNKGTNDSVTYTVDDNAPEFKQMSRNVSYMRSGEAVNVSARVNETNLRAGTVDIDIMDNTSSLIQDVAESCSTVDAHNKDCWSTWNGEDGGGNNVTDGNYTFRIYAEDKADNTNSKTHTNEFVVDNTAPNFVGFNVNDSYVNSEAMVRFNVNVEDLSFDSANTNVTVVRTSDASFVKDVSENCAADGSCNVEWTPSGISEGNYTFKITSTDKAGNTDSGYDTDQWFYYDNNPPNVDTVTINDSIVKTGAKIDVNVTTPGDTGTDLKFVEVDGYKNLTYDSGNSVWTGTTESEVDGDNIVNVTAVDLADNKGVNNTVSYTIDTKPPSFEQVSRNTTYMRSGDLVEFSTLVNDSNLDESTVDITVRTDGGTLQEDVSESSAMINSTHTNFTATWNAKDAGSNVTEDNYTFRIYAEDKADNTNSKTHTNEFVVDNTAPSFTNLNVNDSYTNGSEDIKFAVEVTDQLFDSSSTDITVVNISDGSFIQDVAETCSSVSGDTYDCSSTWSPSGAEGNYTFKISSTDKAGATNTSYSASEWTYYDTTAPTITSNDLNDTIVQTGATIKTWATVSDKLPIIEFLADVNSLGYNGTHWVGTTTAGSDETINMTAEDAANNTGIDETLTYTIDDSKPTGTLESNATYNVSRSDNIVNFTATASDSNLKSVELENKSSGTYTSMNNASGNYYLEKRPETLGLDSDNNYSVKLRLEDEANNVKIETYYLVVDDTAPTVSSFESNATFDTSRSDNTVNFTASINDDNLLNADVNESTMTKTGSEWSLTEKPQNLGCPTDTTTTCLLELTTADKAGNTRTANYWLTVDDETPLVNSVSINDSIIQSDTEIDVKVNVSGETDSTIDTVRAEGQSVTWNGTYWIGTVAVDNDGAMDVEAIDEAGNKGTNNSMAYTIDDTSPSISSLGSNATFDVTRSNETIRANLTASDTYLRTVELDNKSSSNDVTMSNAGGNEYEKSITAESIGCSKDVNRVVCELNATAEDEADNTNFATYSLVIDDVAPIYNNITINDSIIKSDSYINVSVELSNDTGSTIQQATAEGQNLSYIRNSVWNASVQIDNDEYLNVSMKDKAPNTALNSSVKYTVDDTPPSIGNLSSNATMNVSRSDSLVRFEVNASDANNLSQVLLEGNSMTETQSHWFLKEKPQTLGCSTEGLCTLNATAVDNAGWTNQTQYNLKIDDTAPNITGFDALNDTEGSPDTAKGDWYLDWELNYTDNTSSNASMYAVNLSSSQIVGDTKNLSVNDSDTFKLIEQPTAFNATNGTFRFEAVVEDAAGNQDLETYLLEISAQPPIINWISASDTTPEVGKQFQVESNVTDTNTIVNVTANVSWSTGWKQVRMSLPSGNEVGGNTTGGVYEANFTANESGKYDVEIRAEDGTEQVKFDSKEDVFNAVGKTTAKITLDPSKKTLDNLTENYTESYLLDINLTNTGLVTAYNTEIGTLSTPSGINTNSTSLSCGTLANGSSCTTTVQVNVTAAADTGNLSIFTPAGWTNPDGTDDSVSNTTKAQIKPNPVLKETNGTTTRTLWWNETVNVSTNSVYSFGNTKLENVKITRKESSINNSDYLQSKYFTFQPNNFNVSQGETENSKMQVTIDKKGNYTSRMLVNATGNNCGTNCTDTKTVDLDVFRKLDVTLQNSSKTVYRQPTQLNAKVVNEEDTGVQNYTVGFYDNNTLIQNTTTNSSGVAKTTWDTTNGEVGPHNVSVKIWDNNSRYLKAFNDSDAAEITLRDSLNLSATVQDNDMYWYDTHQDHNITVNHTILNRNENAVQNAIIALYTNATGAWKQAETCSTNTTGQCDIIWNTNVSMPTTAEIRINSTKGSYFDTSTTITDLIDILGGFSVDIVKPTATQDRSSDLNIVKGTNQELNASVKDENGTEVTPELNWTVNTSGTLLVGQGKQITWNVPGTLEYGVHELNATAESDSVNTTDTVKVEVYDPVNATVLSTSNTTAERNKTTVTFTAEVNNTRTDTRISGYTCELWDNNALVSTTATNSSGLCSLSWSPNQTDYVGNHTLTVDISKSEGSEWYLPVQNAADQTEIDIEEKLNATIETPKGIIHAYSNETLNASVKNVFGEYNSKAAWKLNGTVVGSGKLDYWNTGNLELGNNTLTAEAYKTNYTNDTATVNVTVYGYAEQNFTLKNNYSRGQQINLSVKVQNANNTSAINGYPVTLYKEFNGTETLWRNGTTTNGWYNTTWNTTNATEGNYNITSSINDNPTLHYNATTENTTRNIFLGGKLNLSTNVNTTKLYRDQTSTPRTVNISTTVTDIDSNISNANITFNADGRQIGRCNTVNGTCSFTWNPSNNTTVGNITLAAEASKDGYYNSNKTKHYIQIRTSSKPSWNQTEEKLAYNFSTKQGVDILPKVLETYTDRGIPDYNITVGWGKRKDDYQDGLQKSSWNNTGSGNILDTAEGLFFNGTTAETTVDLEDREHVELKTANVTGTWTLSVYNGTWKDHSIPAFNGTRTVTFNDKNITKIQVKTLKQLELQKLVLKDTDLKDRRELLERTVLGENAFEYDDGDFENNTLKNDYNACLTDGSCPLNGTYIGQETGYNDYVEGNDTEGVFGTEGALINISDLPSGEKVLLRRDYDDKGGSQDFSDAAMISYWINSSMNYTARINDSSTCSYSEKLSSTDGWEERQINLSSFKDSCGDQIGLMQLEFGNNKSQPISEQIKVDEFTRLKEVKTNENGTRALNWLPPETGNYSFKLAIKPKQYYNVSKTYAFKKIQLTSGGGGKTAGEETGGESTGENEAAPESGKNVTSFTVTPQTFNETVASQTYGTIGTVEIANNISETITINMSEVENAALLDVKDSIKLSTGEKKDMEIGFNSSTPGTYDAKLAVFRDATDERKDVNITLDIQNISMNIENISAENGVNNVTADDAVEIKANITYNNSQPATSATWTARIEEESCGSLSSAYDNNTKLWNISCNAPELENNPLNAEFELEATADNLKLKGNRDITYRDVTAPFVTNKKGENVKQGEKALITVDAYDNDKINNITATAFYAENGTEMQNLTFTNFSGTYKANFTNTTYEGDYDVKVDLEDVNNHTRTVTIPVSVFPFISFTGQMDNVETRFEFKRPGTNLTLEEQSTSEDYNFTVQNRSYDIKMDANVTNSQGEQKHSLAFKNSQVDSNKTNPIKLSSPEIGDSVNYSHPGNTTNKSFAAISISSNISFQEAIVTLNYTLTEDFDEQKEKDLQIYKCEYDNISKCTTEDWSNLTGDVNTSENIVSATTGTTSSYIIERFSSSGQNDNDENTETEEDSNTGGGQASSGGGGGSGGLTPENDTLNGSKDSNRDDEIGEKPFIISPRIFQPLMFRGEERTFLLEIDNNKNTTIALDLNVTGELTKILEIENENVTIAPNSSVITRMKASVPEDAAIKSYNGIIKARYGNETTTSPQQILVARKGITGMTLEINPLAKSVKPGNNVTFSVEIDEIDLETPINITTTYYFRESETDKIIAQMNESVSVSQPASYKRSFNTSGVGTGSYYLQAVAHGRNTTVVDAGTFTVSEKFWTSFKTRLVILLALVAILTGGGWKGYQEYWKKREEEARYVFPVDYSKLPVESEDNFWTGKVAETEKDAFIDPDDLTTHAIVSGSTGSGKSVTANVIAEEALENDIPVIVFDPTAQWTGFVKELRDNDLEKHYSRFDLDPQNDTHPYRGVIKEIDSEDPDIDFEDLQNPGEITVFTLNNLTTEQFDQAVRKIIDQIFEIEWEESPNLEMLVVFDEVHRLLEEYGGQGGYKALEKGAREFRKWGIGLMMCSQVTADFKQAISGNIMTEIQMQTKSMEDINRVEKKYGDQFAKRISSEDVGTGMIQNSNYNDGDPWFVDFRPTYHNPHKIPDKELKKYHELSEELGKLKQKLDKMEEQGTDVRDKKLEFQLAENKLKEGRFKMASMYIDSLKDELDLQ